MEHVTLLKQREIVQLDAGRLEDLFVQLGEVGAEDVICRALEELAARLAHIERCYRETRFDDMRKNARSLVAISEQIGMQKLADVACDVTLCIDNEDGIALSATLSRLLRVGEGSLSEVWDMQGLSI